MGRLRFDTGPLKLHTLTGELLLERPGCGRKYSELPMASIVSDDRAFPCASGVEELVLLHEPQLATQRRETTMPIFATGKYGEPNARAMILSNVDEAGEGRSIVMRVTTPGSPRSRSNAERLARGYCQPS